MLPDYAHALTNTGSQPLQYLVFSNQNTTAIVGYPGSRKCPLANAALCRGRPRLRSSRVCRGRCRRLVRIQLELLHDRRTDTEALTCIGPGKPTRELSC